jgi:hypothetical protein
MEPKPNSDKIISLTAIMDIRGKLLNEFYKDMKNTADRIKTKYFFYLQNLI